MHNISTHNTSIQEYRNMVNEAATERNGDNPIFNASLEHATIVMEAMFRFANENVDILTGNLNPEVYAQYSVLTAASDFLFFGEGRKVRILLEHNVEWIIRTHPLLLVFNQAELLNRGSFEIRCVKKEYQRRYKYHFTVMDQDCFRYEEDRDEPSAIAVFGNPKTALHLQGIFDTIWNSGVSCVDKLE